MSKSQKCAVSDYPAGHPDACLDCDPCLGALEAKDRTLLLEAAKLLEAAELAHANCPECEGEEEPELCPVCFPLFDDARIKRRIAIAKAESHAHASALHTGAKP